MEDLQSISTTLDQRSFRMDHDKDENCAQLTFVANLPTTFFTIEFEIYGMFGMLY